MKTRKIFKIMLFRTGIFLMLVFSFQLNAFSQVSLNPVSSSDSDNYLEALYITSDRDLYFAGENVYLKIYLFDRNSHDLSGISRVVYIDLPDRYNNPVIQLKAGLENSSGEAWLRLPDTIPSGNYVLRVYTSWMKNFPEDMFATKIISVINPFGDIRKLPVPDKEGLPDNTTPTSEEGSVTGIIGNENASGITRQVYSDNAGLLIDIDPVDALVREKVRIKISVSGNDGKPSDCNLSVSVVKSFTISNSSLIKPANHIGQTINTIPDGKEYYPEIKGHIISGKIISKITGEPLKNEMISMSFVGKSALCRFSSTDENGRFSFIASERGVREIVIQPLSPLLKESIITLDDPFPLPRIKYELPPLFIDTTYLEEINRAVIAMQVREIYEKELSVDISSFSGNNELDFYGDPDKIIDLNGYIELTSLKEVIKEIVPGVTTNSVNDRSNFRMVNRNPTGTFENSPMVLLDGVPVSDIDMVLGIRPSEIERIDVFNTRYFISDLVIEGIISFKSKKGDLSMIPFDRSIFRREYHGLQEKTRPYMPEYNTDSLRNSRIPDFRNTLFWEPSLKTGKTGSVITEFYTSDEAGSYSIIVEGVTPGGQVIRKVVPLTVRSSQ